MKYAYNLALVPTQNSQAFINYAQELTQQVQADQYLIGEKSIPHVTLCHFEAEENALPTIWQAAQQLKPQQLQLTFATQRNQLFAAHPRWGNVAWIFLNPDHGAQLKELHLALAQIVTPTNLAFEHYDPHLTLFNSQNKTACTTLVANAQLPQALCDQFRLVLGHLDGVGQITSIIYPSG